MLDWKFFGGSARAPSWVVFIRFIKKKTPPFFKLFLPHFHFDAVFPSAIDDSAMNSISRLLQKMQISTTTTFSEAQVLIVIFGLSDLISRFYGNQM